MEIVDKKKVLFLITKSNWGGAQRYIFDLATNLPKDKYESVVAVGGDGVLIEKLIEDGIRVIKIPSLQRDISFIKEFTASRTIFSILKEEQPDIFHINSSKAGLFGAILGRIAHVPRIVFTAHGWAFNEDRSFPSRLVLKYFHWLTVLFTHTTIAVSNELKQQLNWPLIQNKISVVHNGRAVSDFLSKEEARAFLIKKESRLNEYHNDLWTGTIAELHPIKGHDVMIEAMAELVAFGHQLRHLIIGDGEEFENLKKLIVEKNLTEHVFLLGHIHEAAKYLKAFDIFTLTSRSEALAYTVIEAAQAGLPIIASRVGGIPEIISHNESGLLIEPDNQTTLKNTIKMLVINTEMQTNLSVAAKKRGQDFSLEKMLENTMEIYSK